MYMYHLCFVRHVFNWQTYRKQFANAVHKSEQVQLNEDK